MDSMHSNLSSFEPPSRLNFHGQHALKFILLSSLCCKTVPIISAEERAKLSPSYQQRRGTKFFTFSMTTCPAQPGQHIVTHNHSGLMVVTQLLRIID
jgi:hypothetical protein